MTDDERRIAAAHEAGHALVAHTLGRRVLRLTLDGPDGPQVTQVSADSHRPGHLNGDRPPTAYFHHAIDEIVTILAGPIAEPLAADLPMTSPSAAVVLEAVHVVDDSVPAAVLTRPNPYAAAPWDDEQLVELLAIGITGGYRERILLTEALRLRAETLVNGDHFKFVHRHLAVALMRDGDMSGDEVRVEIERGHLHYVKQHGKEMMDDGEAAA